MNLEELTIDPILGWGKVNVKLKSEKQWRFSPSKFGYK